MIPWIQKDNLSSLLLGTFNLFNRSVFEPSRRSVLDHQMSSCRMSNVSLCEFRTHSSFAENSVSTEKVPYYSMTFIFLPWNWKIIKIMTTEWLLILLWMHRNKCGCCFSYHIKSFRIPELYIELQLNFHIVLFVWAPSQVTVSTIATKAPTETIRRWEFFPGAANQMQKLQIDRWIFL